MGAFAGPKQQRIDVDLNANNLVTLTLNNFPGADNYVIKVDGFLSSSTSSTTGIVTISPGLTRNITIDAYQGNNYLFTRTKNIKIFDYVGAAQTWTVPSNTSRIYTDVQGAQGGNAGAYGGGGGGGGRAKSYINVSAGSTLYFYVGGAGQDLISIGCTSLDPGFRIGGFNGGGNGGKCTDAYGCAIGSTNYAYGASGGGASDIRTASTDLSTRIVVAGGGGGNYGSSGGGGGGDNGVDGGYSIGGVWPTSVKGLAATTTAAGAGGTGGAIDGNSGTIGIGGSGAIIAVYGDNPGRAGGGGGGYYGGGGGGAGSNYGAAGGGGGGSGYIIPPFRSFVTSSGFGSITSGYRSGNGRILVAWDSTTPYSDIVTSGLILNLDAQNYYSYPGSGTTWTDLSGSGNNGTLVNGVGYSSSNGGSLTFNGTNQYVDCGPVSAIGSSLTGLTVNVWINPSVKDIRCIAENGTNYTTNTFYMFQENANYFTFMVFGTTYDSVYANFIYQTNTWYNLTGVWSSNNRVDLYCNGTLCSGNRVGAVQSSVINGNTNLLLGSRNYGSYPFSGNYASASFYNRALSASEIQQNFNATRGRFGV